MTNGFSWREANEKVVPNDENLVPKKRRNLEPANAARKRRREAIEKIKRDDPDLHEFLTEMRTTVRQIDKLTKVGKRLRAMLERFGIDV